MNRLTYFSALLSVILISMLSGCKQGEAVIALKEMGEGERAAIKVMYIYDEDAFSNQYRNLFSAKYPNIEVEMVSTQVIGSAEEDELNKFISEQNPDVLMLNPNHFGKLAAEGQLYDLGAVIKQDKFDIKGMNPGVIEFIKSKGGEKLYGLTPAFYSQAIFFNKDLFEKNGINFPKDNMTWEELLQLSRRFPTNGTGDSRIYGLTSGYSRNLFSLANAIGRTNGLNYVDPDNMQITINTDAWRKVFEMSVNALNSGAVYVQKTNELSSGPIRHEDFLLKDPFISGKAAMTITGPYMINQLEEAKRVLKERAVQNWDLVTMPVDPRNPDTSTSLSYDLMVNWIFAVNSRSSNLRAAWEFVKYIHSEEYARIMAQSNNGDLPIRTSYIKDKEGRNLEAFFKLKPSITTSVFDKLPKNFPLEFNNLAERELNSVMEGQKSLDEALQMLQKRGQEVLIQSKQSESF